MTHWLALLTGELLLFRQVSTLNVFFLSPAPSPALTTSEPAAKKRTTKSKSKLATAEVTTQPEPVAEAEPLPKKRVNN